MKNLKYLLFTVLIGLISLSNVEAACVFGNDTLNFTCSETNGKVSCSIGGTGAANYTLKDYSKVSSDDVNACKTIIMRSDAEPNIVIVKSEVYLYSVGTTPQFDNTFNKPLDTPLPGKTKEEASAEEQAQETLKKYNGKTCVYNTGQFKYVCTIKNGKPSCELGCLTGYTCGDVHSFDKNNINHKLNSSDFLKNGNFVCPTNSANSIATCGTRTKINYYTSKTIIKSVGLNCTGEDLILGLYYAPNAEDFEGNLGHNNNKPTTPTTPTTPETPSGEGENKKDDTLDLEHFCQGKIQGAFTALGWVFFVVKILVPIILIIFGSIDLSKAVIASKDDEIKKSVKTLLIRVIAGIIIFFIPTILNMVIKMFDRSDVYNGTFMDCTSCMLDPTQDTCATLIGGSSK